MAIAHTLKALKVAQALPPGKERKRAINTVHKRLQRARVRMRMRVAASAAANATATDGAAPPPAPPPDPEDEAIERARMFVMVAQALPQGAERILAVKRARKRLESMRKRFAASPDENVAAAPAAAAAVAPASAAAAAAAAAAEPLEEDPHNAAPHADQQQGMKTGQTWHGSYGQYLNSSTKTIGLR